MRRQSATEVAHDVLELARSGLFDAPWYERRYEGAAARCGDPLVDFCNSGWPDNHWPSFHFQTDFYLDSNPDVRDLSINPLLHYFKHGERENRRPSPHFDVGWYRERYAVPDGHSCLAHFLAHRRTSLNSPNERFDAAWYVTQYPETDCERSDPVEQYSLNGAAKGHAISRDEYLIAQSGLFDPDYYGSTYDLRVDDRRDLIHHFLKIGWRKGYNPNACFATERYLTVNDDVAKAGVNPLLHYIQDGEGEERSVVEGFDAAQYRALHGIDRSRSALGAYLENTRRQRRLARSLQQAAGTDPSGSVGGDVDIADVIRSSGLFDENHYLISYPDVRLSGLDPLDHFCRYGSVEGRRPNPYFDPAWYRYSCMADEKAIANPLLHYILHGERALKRPIVYFDTAWYAATQELGRLMSPLLHYLHHRRRQTVSPTPLFDVDRYRRSFGSTVGPNRDLFAHYLRVGITRPVDPGPRFNATEYRNRCMPAAKSPFKSVPGAEVHERIRRERLNPLVHHLLNTFEERPALLAEPAL